MLTRKDLESLENVLEAYRRVRNEIDRVGDANINRDRVATELTKAWLEFGRQVEKSNA
jgi:hypothetical protein